MKRSGFTCIAKFRYPLATVLFGPNTDPATQHPFANIVTNGLLLFKTAQNADESCKLLREWPQFESVTVGSLELEWMDERDERWYHNRNSLFVLARDPDTELINCRLVGPFVFGSQRYCNEFSLLTSNGLTCFSSFKEAEICRREVTRQAGMPSMIGRMTLKN